MESLPTYSISFCFGAFDFESKVHRKMGFKDDPNLGSFLDAICDKVVNVVCVWSFILLCGYDSISTFQLITFLWVCFTVIGYETVLAIVRIQDFYAATTGEVNFCTLYAGSQQSVFRQEICRPVWKESSRKS